MTSKINSIEPILDQHGQHQTYAGQYGLLYEFVVSFENGDSGKANAKTAIPSYKIGDEVEYSKKVFQKPGRPDFVLINGIKKVEGFKPNSTYNNPDTNNKAAMSMAINITLIMLTKFDLHYDSLETVFTASNNFYKYIVAEENDRNVHLDRYHALEHAITMSLVPDIATKYSGGSGSKVLTIIAIAEVVYEHIKSVANSPTKPI